MEGGENTCSRVPQNIDSGASSIQMGLFFLRGFAEYTTLYELRLFL